MDRLNGHVYAPFKERKNRRAFCKRSSETCSDERTVPRVSKLFKSIAGPFGLSLNPSQGVDGFTTLVTIALFSGYLTPFFILDYIESNNKTIVKRESRMICKEAVVSILN
jgi:hypothetical protein